jgi:hypothetical protein
MLKLYQKSAVIVDIKQEQARRIETRTRTYRDYVIPEFVSVFGPGIAVLSHE